VRIELNGLKQLQKKLDPNLLTAAYVRALNSTSTSAVAALSTAVTGRYTILVKDFKSTIRKKKATYADPVAVIDITSSPIPLAKFRAKKVRVRRKGRTYWGASAKVLKKERARRYKGAFMATMKSGHTGVFVRKGSARLPILEKRVISPTTMVKMVDGEDIVEEIFRKHFKERFLKDYKYRIGKVK